MLSMGMHKCTHPFSLPSFEQEERRGRVGNLLDSIE